MFRGSDWIRYDAELQGSTCRHLTFRHPVVLVPICYRLRAISEACHDAGQENGEAVASDLERGTGGPSSIEVFVEDGVDVVASDPTI